MRIRAGVTESTAPSRRRRFAGHSVGAEVCHNLGDNMNANELAVELERYLKGEEYDRLVWEIPDLLRQQQAEIEALKKNLDIALMMIDNRNDIIDKLDLK